MDARASASPEQRPNGWLDRPVTSSTWSRRPAPTTRARRRPLPASAPTTSRSCCTRARPRRAGSTSTSTATPCTTRRGTTRATRSRRPAVHPRRRRRLLHRRLDVVQEVWARVAEDYAPFNIDVTTEIPGPRDWSAPRPRTRATACGPRSPPTRPCAPSWAAEGLRRGRRCRDLRRGRDGHADQYYQPAFALPEHLHRGPGRRDRQPRGRPHPGAIPRRPGRLAVLPGRDGHQDLVADDGRGVHAGDAVLQRRLRRGDQDPGRLRGDRAERPDPARRRLRRHPGHRRTTSGWGR